MTVVDLPHIRAIAQRELRTRARTRAFRATTVLLMLVTLALSQAPLLFRWIDQVSGPTTIEVSIGNSQPKVVPDIPTVLSLSLNANPLAGATGGTAGSGSGSGSGGTDTPKYKVTLITDPDAAKTRVADGKTGGLLIVTRDATTHDLQFTYVTQNAAIDRTAAIVQQALAGVVIQDRMASAGISGADQQKIFAPPTFTTEDTKTSGSGGAGGPGSGGIEQIVSGMAVGFILAIILFLAIIIYGQWIAYSVAEEKTSRVMEVILGAATPFELLGGKIVGVGGLAIVQYVIVFLPAVVATLLQGQIASLIFGGSAAAVGLPAGLSVSLLLAFGAFFILGFGLYSVLYAGAAALVSRTEDINQIVAPMTMVSTAGYLAAVWSATGVISGSSPIVVVMSYIPFFSPYVMLTRFGAGNASVVEVLISLAILAATVPAALWLAARFYSAGVLMYGQRPSVRLIWRVIRGNA